MYDPDNPKIQDKGKGTAAHFEKAYWQVMEQVEAPVESINALLPLMYDSYEAGLPPAQMRYLAQYLPDGQWRWPEYERQLPDMRRREYEATKKHIETNADLKIAASIAGFDVLRNTVRELLGEKIPAIRKWQQAQDVCEMMIAQGHEAKALELLRNAGLEKNEERFNDPEELEAAKGEMAEMLVHYIIRLAQSFRQRQRMSEVSKSFPYLKLSITEESKARPECIALSSDVVLRCDNPYWRDNFPPCERIGCLCHVIQMNERMIQQSGLKVVDN